MDIHSSESGVFRNELAGAVELRARGVRQIEHRYVFVFALEEFFSLGMFSRHIEHAGNSRFSHCPGFASPEQPAAIHTTSGLRPRFSADSVNPDSRACAQQIWREDRARGNGKTSLLLSEHCRTAAQVSERDEREGTSRP